MDSVSISIIVVIIVLNITINYYYRNDGNGIFTEMGDKVGIAVIITITLFKHNNNDFNCKNIYK